jgi:hypothetical protein
MVNKHAQYIWHVVLKQESDLLFSNQQVYPFIEEFMQELGLTYRRWPNIETLTLTPQIWTEVHKILSEGEPLGIRGRSDKSQVHILAVNKANQRVVLMLVTANPEGQTRVIEQYVNDSFASFFSTLYIVSALSPPLMKFMSASDKKPPITKALDPQEAFEVSELFQLQAVKILGVVRSCIEDIDPSSTKDSNNFWSEYLLDYEL